MQKVLFIDYVHPMISAELTNHGFQCDYFPDYQRDDFMAIAGDYFGIIIRSKIKLDKEILERASHLKFIGRVGAGMEGIDVVYALGKGIQCFNSPEGNRDAVGEHTLGMLLSLMNCMNRADREVRLGKWIREGNRGVEIKGKTVGIIGYGNMGNAFARRLRGFEANVKAYDKYKDGYSDEFVHEATLDELFETTDILSMHVPLTPETRFMVNDAFLDKFRKKIWLINTSRGEVVKTSDLARHLQSGKVLGAALDVLEYEDASFEAISRSLPDDFKYLLESDNVILTPHIAGWTVESNLKLAQVLIEKIKIAFPKR